MTVFLSLAHSQGFAVTVQLCQFKFLATAELILAFRSAFALTVTADSMNFIQLSAETLNFLSILLV